MSDREEEPIEMIEDTEVDDVVFRSRLERHRHFLEERIDPDFGLLDKLRANRGMVYRQFEDISAERVPFRKSRMIIDVILQKSGSEMINKFCEALCETKQEHLVNYVHGDGGYKPQFGGNWPLDEAKVSTVDDNIDFLTETIDSEHGLLTCMFQKKAITQRQMESITTYQEPCKRNEALLKIVRRGSQSLFEGTIEALEASNQRSIADVLIHGGMIVSVHSKADSEFPAIDATEEEIVQQIDKILQNKTPDETRHILEKYLSLKTSGLIAVKRKESIVFFFHCKRLIELRRLLESLLTEELHKNIEMIYNGVRSSSGRPNVKVQVTWNDAEFSKAERKLQVYAAVVGSSPSSIPVQIANFTECIICMDVLANPKILPCVHTFCLECLEKYRRSKTAGDELACPICRSAFIIPDGGLSSLPHNFFIDRMVGMLRLSDASTNEHLCGTCPTEESAQAKLFCIECEQNLCESCVKIHRKIRSCQNHKVVDAGNNLKRQTLRSRCCEKHPGEYVNMYCVDDEAAMCLFCFSESHQSHKCLTVEKASEEFSDALKFDLKPVIEKLPEIHFFLEQFDKWKNDLLDQIIALEKQICVETGRLHVLIDLHANRLNTQFVALKNERMKAMESTKEDVERLKVTIESHATYSLELLNKAPVDICREANQLKTRTLHLASLTKNCSIGDFNCDGITFKSLNLEDVLRLSNIANVIGDVQVKDLSSSIVKHDTAEKKNMQTMKQMDECLDRQKKAEVERRTVQVHGVGSSEIADFIVGLMRNRRRGGGEIESESFDADSGILTVRFKDKKFADHFLAQKSISLLGKSYDTHAPPNLEKTKSREAEEASRTVDVHGVQSQEVVQDIVDLLENKRRGGGPVVKHLLNESHGILTVQFKDKTYAEHFLRKEVLSAFGVSYYVKLPLSPDAQVRI